jgi:hypothetical protein
VFVFLYIKHFIGPCEQLKGKLPDEVFVVALLRKQVQNEYPQESQLNASSQSSDDTSQPTSQKPKQRSIFARLEGLGSCNKSKKLYDEVDRYLELPREDDHVDPLKFWVDQKNRYPTLAKLSLVYLSMPATSGSVERLFSIAGAIGRARRANVSIENMEKALCVRQELLNLLETEDI